MKVVLTFLPQIVEKNKFELWTSPPLALYVLAACLEHKGHIVRVVDPCEYLKFDMKDHIIEKSIDYLDKNINDADMVCFSCNTFNWGFSKVVVEKLYKIYPDKFYVCGGLHPTLFDQYAIENSKFKYVLRGEGEISMPLLATALEKNLSLTSVPNLSYQNQGVYHRNPSEHTLTVEQMEDTPIPDFKYLTEDNPYYSIPVESSRGCAFSCAFCSIPHRHNWRGLSPDKIVERIEIAIETCSIKPIEKNRTQILFTDDCLTINTKRAEILMKKLYEKYGYDLAYFIEARISNIISDKLFLSIHPGLIHTMQIGVECGYDEGLKKVKKELTLNQLFQGLDIIYANGFAENCFLSFIIGFPWEGEEEISKTLDTVERILRTYGIAISLNWLIFLPSDLWKDRDYYGIVVDESIYDDPMWFRDRSLFFRTHPRLSEEAVNRVEDRIAEIKGYSPRLKFVFRGRRSEIV